MIGRGGYGGGNQEGEGILPTDVDTVVRSFVGECRQMYEAATTGDKASMDTQMYSVMQQMLPRPNGNGSDDRSWQKVGKHARTDGLPTVTTMATMMLKHGSGMTRLAFYPYGGSSQAKGSPIPRTAQFEWINVPVEDDEDDAGRGIMVVSRNEPMERNSSLVPVLQTMVVASENGRGSERRQFLDEITTQRNTADARMLTLLRRGDERESMLLNKVLEVVDVLKNAAADTFAAGNAMMAEGHRAKVGAMRMETNAILTERRAMLTMEDAESELAAAEAALAEGETKGWQGFMSSMMKNEDGAKLITKILDKTLTVIEGKLLGSPEVALRKMGMGDLADIVKELDLNPEQMGKVTGLMTKYASKLNQ